MSLIITNVTNCARCGQDHERLECRPFTRPPEVGGITHFMICPTNGEPIFAAFVETEKQPA